MLVLALLLVAVLEIDALRGHFRYFNQCRSKKQLVAWLLQEGIDPQTRPQSKKHEDQDQQSKTKTRAIRHWDHRGIGTPLSAHHPNPRSQRLRETRFRRRPGATVHDPMESGGGIFGVAKESRCTMLGKCWSPTKPNDTANDTRIGSAGLKLFEAFWELTERTFPEPASLAFPCKLMDWTLA